MPVCFTKAVKIGPDKDFAGERKFPRPLKRNLMTIPEVISMQGLMDHIVLNAEDDHIMIAFYSKILMLFSERLEEYRAGKVPAAGVTSWGPTPGANLG